MTRDEKISSALRDKAMDIAAEMITKDPANKDKYLDRAKTYKPNDDGQMHLHHYVPSTIHMGDCDVCGHLQDSPLHIKSGQ